MQFTAVESSHIAAVAYSPETSVIMVRFTDGRTVQHDNISAMQYACLMSAPSKGKHYAANFKDGILLTESSAPVKITVAAVDQELRKALAEGPKETFFADECCTKRLIRAERNGKSWTCDKCGTPWVAVQKDGFLNWEPNESYGVMGSGNLSGLRLD